ncbi:MAG TPA: aldolase/citrate lyase family protein [Ktedonobacterales bacterium]|nr:aldolase/citrate lyase family protein [Ktedonobacterales bacterium]
MRRSVLVVPLLDTVAVEGSWRHEADAVALDLGGDSVRPATRTSLAQAIATAARGGAEVFVCVERDRVYAQLKSAAGAVGLTGVAVRDAESARDVERVDEVLREHERNEGMLSGSLEILPLVGTARGVWNVREVVTASARIRCAGIDEPGLCRSLDIVPHEQFDPFGFARGRLIVETLAAVKLPIGIGHPLGALPRDASQDDVLRVADRARNTGFKGALCPFSSWVAACNRAFTPTDEQVAYYREVRQAFAEGVKRGTAAVPFPGGRMIDVPVDERARLVIDWSERCRARDAQKAAALSRAWQPR